jgi:hypothetical protein
LNNRGDTEEPNGKLYALPIHELKKGVKLGDTFG